jgi:hypothetical protein
MFFKRPSFKYGGEAEGIKQTVRKNFNAGTNPNRTGNAFVKDIFETKPATNFNVMNEGIGQGLQMKNPNAAMPIADFDDSYLQSVLQPKEKTPSINEGDVELGLGQTKETATKSSEVLSGEKEPPGIFGFKFDRPIKGEDFLGETSKKLIEENKLRQREEAQAFIDKRAEEKNVPDFDTSKLPQSTTEEKSGQDDFATADNLAAKQLSNVDPSKILTEAEKEGALTGKDIPMFEKFLGPKEAEIKRKAYLAAAKAGFRLMKKDVATVGEAAIVDAERILKEKSDLERVAALKGLDFEKDVMLKQMSIDAAILKKDPTKLNQTISFYKRQFKKMYGDKITDAEATTAAENFIATYGGSLTKGLIDAGKENAAILARNAGFPDATGKDAQVFQKVGFTIASDPTGTLNAANMFAIPTKEIKEKDDSGKKTKKNVPDFNDFAFTPGAFYYNTEDGTIFQYTGKGTITTQQSYDEAVGNSEFKVYSPTKSVNPV